MKKLLALLICAASICSVCAAVNANETETAGFEDAKYYTFDETLPERAEVDCTGGNQGYLAYAANQGSITKKGVARLHGGRWINLKLNYLPGTYKVTLDMKAPNSTLTDAQPVFAIYTLPEATAETWQRCGNLNKIADLGDGWYRYSILVNFPELDAEKSRTIQLRAEETGADKTYIYLDNVSVEPITNVLKTSMIYDFAGTNNTIGTKQGEAVALSDLSVTRGVITNMKLTDGYNGGRAVQVDVSGANGAIAFPVKLEAGVEYKIQYKIKVPDGVDISNVSTANQVNSTWANFYLEYSKAVNLGDGWYQFEKPSVGYSDGSGDATVANISTLAIRFAAVGEGFRLADLKIMPKQTQINGVNLLTDTTVIEQQSEQYVKLGNETSTQIKKLSMTYMVSKDGTNYCPIQQDIVSGDALGVRKSYYYTPTKDLLGMKLKCVLTGYVDANVGYTNTVTVDMGTICGETFDWLTEQDGKIRAGFTYIGKTEKDYSTEKVLLALYNNGIMEKCTAADMSGMTREVSSDGYYTYTLETELEKESTTASARAFMWNTADMTPIRESINKTVN